MYATKALSLTLLFLALTLGCSKDGSSASQEPGELLEKSPKRGLAYNLSDAADLEALKSGVSWWYNWYFATDAPGDYNSNYQMEFLPMLWGNNSPANFAQVKNFILAHPEIKYLLVLNEPNLTDQANQSPTQAATDWVAYEQLLDDLAAEQRTVELVDPQITWGTMPGFEDPIVWMDAFYAAYQAANNGADPRIDYLAFHWYDYGLASQLDRLQKYGKKIWVTEMANWNANISSYEQQAEQMTQMVAICENRSDVFRYAWFIGRGDTPDNNYTYLFTPNPGELNSLGELYLSLPY
ncbi:MAG: glycosyl hydrolase [Calditrichia bacterium]